MSKTSRIVLGVAFGLVLTAAVIVHAAYRDASAVLDPAQARRPFPSDSLLRQRFIAHRPAFEHLVAMTRQDSLVIRIAPDFTWARDSITASLRSGSTVGFTTKRWNEYRHLFRTLGIEAGTVWRPEDKPRVIYLIVQANGLVTSGSAKGYAVSAAHLMPACESLDVYATRTSTGTCFKPLDGEWNLYFER